MGIPLWKSVFFFFAVSVFSAYLFPSPRELGLFYSMSHAFNDARFYLERQFHQDPGDVRNTERYLESLLYEGHYELFERAGAKLIRVFPKEFFVHRVMAEFYKDTLRFDEACRHWLEMMRLNPALEEPRENLISYYIMSKNQKGLAEVYELERSRGTKDPDIYEALARLYSLQGRVDEARAVYLDWIERFPALSQPREKLAELYEYQGEPEKALGLYRGLAATESDGPEALSTFIEKLILYRKSDEAFRAISDYAERFPNDKELINFISDFSLKFGMSEDSVNLLESLRSRFPSRPVFLKLLGEIYFGWGNYQQARSFLERYHEKTGGDYRSHHVLGDVMRELGDERASRREYEKALKLLRAAD